MENKENKNNIIINTEAIHDIIEKTNKINNNKKERNNVDDKEEKFEPYAVLKDFNDKYEDLDLDDNIIYQDNEEKMEREKKEKEEKLKQKKLREEYEKKQRELEKSYAKRLKEIKQKEKFHTNTPIKKFN